LHFRVRDAQSHVPGDPADMAAFADVRRRSTSDWRSHRRAIQEADRFFGTTVHAARVASQALGGEVLVDVVRGLSRTRGSSSLETERSRAGVSMARTDSSPSTSQIVSRRASLFKRHSRTLGQGCGRC
jgi:hypothetical protein